MTRISEGNNVDCFPIRYDLFGVTASSELLLPLPPTCDEPEIAIVLGQVVEQGTLLSHMDGEAPFRCLRQGQAVVLVWPGARFRVEPGCIVIDAEDPALAAHLLVPPVWAMALSVRGRESLHGSAVTHDGKSIAILGASGSGKTTAALTMIRRGWNLVSDDLLVFDRDCRLLPGPPWIRVTQQDSTSFQGYVDPGGKRRIDLSVTAQPTPITAMFVIAPEHEALKRLHGAQAVRALLQQVYNPIRVVAEQAQHQLELVHSLASRIPIFGAQPRSLQPEQFERIVLDLAS